MPHEPGTNGAEGSRHVLRVFRLKPGERAKIRTLSEAYDGLFTHFVRGRSKYCDPLNCNPADHRTGRFWKGYASAELWLPRETLWMPIVLEITEALELDLRGRWERGQCWELTREKQVGKRHPPIVGVLVGKAEGKLPPAFGVLDVLTHLYHADGLQLGELNPMPPRVLVAASPGAAPAGPATNGHASAPAADSAEAAKFWQQARARMGEFLKQHNSEN